jgi:hypothetical protein
VRRLLIAFAVVLFCSSSIWADSILDVNISGTFIATQPCSSNCTENIGINFQFDLTNYPYGSNYGYAVPGTTSVWASGFLGSFDSLSYQGSNGYINLSMGYMPFLDPGGDELDIRFSVNPPAFPVGVDTISMEFWGTHSNPAYIDAFGSSNNCCVQPTYYTSTVTPVAVPDETSFLSLSLTALGAVGLVWRWRRRDSQRA